MFYTAEESAEIISEFVSLDWPSDKEKLYKILTLVNKKIWKEGSWWGMIGEFFVRTRKGPSGERYIVCPPGYDILKAVNINGRPKLNRDSWFQFHKNACGTIDHDCGNWTEQVVDMGEFPVINDIHKGVDRPENNILIGARLTGAESLSDEKHVRIEGEWHKEGPVLTFEKEKFPDNRVEFLNEEEQFQTVFGMKIALNEKIRFSENIWWKRVSAIRKSITVNPVEVYAIHGDANRTLQLLAVLQPHEKISKHRRYLVPDSCVTSCSSSCSSSCECNDCCPAVHVKLKISEPTQIVYGTQPVYTRDDEALISLAIAMNEMFDHKKPANSIPFMLNGIKQLEDHNRESQTDEVSPVQVIGPYVDEVPEIIRHYNL